MGTSIYNQPSTKPLRPSGTPVRSDVLVLKQALKTIGFGSPRDLRGPHSTEVPKHGGDSEHVVYDKKIKKCGRFFPVFIVYIVYPVLFEMFWKMTWRHEIKRPKSPSFMEGESGR